MHISEGVLSPPILIGGAVLSAAGLALGIKRLRPEDIPTVSLLTAAFFVASLIHVPLGPSSVHLILNGLLGIILGTSVFPSSFVALFLQAIMFQFGGLTVLGVNTFNMAFPGLVVYILFKGMVSSENKKLSMLGSFLAGSLAVAGSGVLVAASLYLSGKKFLWTAKAILVAHIPVMVIEGIITVMIVSFLRRVKPEILKNN